ncbi:MAG: hypothetical protein IJ134_04165 [Bacilli bacterium]|nr:hypothetical protein [Bacilli bacterium]
MNTYNINDESFKNSDEYQNFLKENPGIGYLRIRASAAGGAIPISGLQVSISKNIDNDKVVFFEGATDISGLIEGIALPAPTINTDNMMSPTSTVYNITATYEPDKAVQLYSVKIYENLYVVQNISIVPDIQRGGLNWQ